MPPGEEAGLGAGSSCGAIMFSKGRCWRPSPSLQSTSTDMYIAFVGFATSGCPAARSSHLTLPRRVCRRQEDGHSAVNKGHRSCVSHTENPIFQRTSGSLLMGNCREIIFLLGMLLLSGNKGLIFQGCQCNIFL